MSRIELVLTALEQDNGNAEEVLMAEHDQRFKTLLREFLPEFLRLFFPDRTVQGDRADDGDDF
jgi:hypothetical protein